MSLKTLEAFEDNAPMATEESMQQAARIWCYPSLAETEMDPRVAEEVAKLLDSFKEIQRMQLAAISTAALGYFKKGEACAEEYKTVALADVQELYAKYEALYKQSS